jgi:hypothetical protein
MQSPPSASASGAGGRHVGSGPPSVQRRGPTWSRTPRVRRSVRPVSAACGIRRSGRRKPEPSSRGALSALRALPVSMPLDAAGCRRRTDADRPTQERPASRPIASSRVLRRETWSPTACPWLDHLCTASALQPCRHLRQLVLNRRDDFGGRFRRLRELVSEGDPPTRGQPEIDIVGRPVVARRTPHVSLNVVSAERSSVPHRDEREVNHPGLRLTPAGGMVRPTSALRL